MISSFGLRSPRTCGNIRTPWHLERSALFAIPDTTFEAASAALAAGLRRPAPGDPERHFPGRGPSPVDTGPGRAARGFPHRRRDRLRAAPRRGIRRRTRRVGHLRSRDRSSDANPPFVWLVAGPALAFRLLRGDGRFDNRLPEAAGEAAPLRFRLRAERRRLLPVRSVAAHPEPARAADTRARA